MKTLFLVVRLSIAALICVQFAINTQAQDTPPEPASEQPVKEAKEPAAEGEEAKPTKPVPKEGDFASGWNTWYSTEVGDSITYEMSLGNSVTREAVKLEGENLTVKHTTRAPESEPIVSPSTKIRSKHRMPVRLPARKIDWREEQLEFGDKTIACSVASWVIEELKTEVWYSVEVPCGGVVKVTSSGQVSIGLTSFSRGGIDYTNAKTTEPTPEATEPVEPEPTPEPVKPEPALEPEPTGDSSTTKPFEHGAPVTMKVPEKIRKAMIDQGRDATRLRVYFEDGKDDSGLKIEYGDESTEVPVIFAAFVKERSDREVPYSVWSTREGGFVDLALDVKTLPAKLEGLKVDIVHSHLQGEIETEIGSFEVPIPDGSDPWEAMRLRGSLPGINRYTLRLTYQQDEETTTVNGFSHWVIVQAPPMFAFENGVSCTATRTTRNGQTALQSRVSFDGKFQLHNGLDPEELILRITRKGRRSVNLSNLSPDMRRLVAKENAASGWQEVGRSHLTDGSILGLQKVEIDGLKVSFSFDHSLAVSSKVLPLLEDWEYRFELHHQDASTPLAVWSGKIDLHIKDVNAIAKAKIRIKTTGMSKPMEVSFKEE